MIRVVERLPEVSINILLHASWDIKGRIDYQSAALLFGREEDKMK